MYALIQTCAYVYVCCLYVLCMYVSMHIRMYIIFIYVFMYVKLYIYKLYVYIYIHRMVCMHAAWKHACMHNCMYNCMYTDLCSLPHAYKHTYLHKYIHAYMHACRYCMQAFLFVYSAYVYVCIIVHMNTFMSGILQCAFELYALKSTVKIAFKGILKGAS